jgi:hypothetical protein
VRAAGLEAAEVDGAIAVRDPWNNVVLLGIGPASDAQSIARLSAAQA